MPAGIKLQQCVTLKQGFLLQNDSVSPVVIKRGKLQRIQSCVTQWHIRIFHADPVKLLGC